MIFTDNIYIFICSVLMFFLSLFLERVTFLFKLIYLSSYSTYQNYSTNRKASLKEEYSLFNIALI